MPKPDHAASEADVLTQRRTNRLSSGVGNGAMLLLGLTAANALLSRSDPGFLNFNPSPWVLLPLLVGVRHGLLIGQLGAVIAAGAVAACFHFWIGHSDVVALLADHSYFFISLLAAGAIGGGLHALLAAPATEATALAQRYARDAQVAEHELMLARESIDDLSHRLLLEGAEFTSLQDRVRALFQPGATQAPGVAEHGLLRLFTELFSVTGAAIYQREGKAWQQTAAIGPSDDHPSNEELTSDSATVVGSALQHNDIATAAMLWRNAAPEDSPAADDSQSLAHDRIVVAIPWAPYPSDGRQPSPTRLLTISRMPFAQATWENLARLQTLFDWVMSTLSMSPRSGAIRKDPGAAPRPTGLLPPEVFEKHIASAVECARQLRFSYRLALFEPTSAADDATQQAFLESVLAEHGQGDSLGGVRLGDAGQDFAVALLMPAATDRAAGQRIERILNHVPEGRTRLRHHLLTIDTDGERFRRQWSQLLRPAQSAPFPPPHVPSA